MPAEYSLVCGRRGELGVAVRLALFDDHASYWTFFDLGAAGFVAVRHDDLALPRGRLLEVRGDGLWAEVACEVPGENWTFGLEGFGLRHADRTEARTAEVGDRVPVGYDLEWDEGHVRGELLVGRERVPVDGPGEFEHRPEATGAAALTWPEWLDLAG